MSHNIRNGPDTSVEYERGVTPVSRVYRELHDDVPPPELDDAILAKARAAVTDRATSELQLRRWRRFAVPVALAASVAMTVSVVLEVNKPPPITQSLEQQLEPENRKSDVGNAPSTVSVAPMSSIASAPPKVAAPAPAPTPTPTPAAPPPPTEAEAPLQVSERKAASNELWLEEAVVTGSRSAPTVSDSPAAVTMPETSQDDLVKAEAETKQQSNRFGATAGVAIMTQSSRVVPVEVKSELSEQVQRDPAQWLAAIQALRKAGNTEAADREWLAFRKAWPEYSVSTETSSQSSQSK